MALSWSKVTHLGLQADGHKSAIGTRIYTWLASGRKVKHSAVESSIMASINRKKRCEQMLNYKIRLFIPISYMSVS